VAQNRSRVRIRQTSNGQQWISTTELTQNIFGGQVPSTEWQQRHYFGTNIEPETIESIVLRAECGYMRELSDLIKETLFFDPHFACETGKRFRSLASIQGKVVEATGPGVDKTRAAAYADALRNEIRRIPNFKQQIIRLDWAHCNGRAALEKCWRENRAGSPYQYSIGELNWIHVRRQQFGPLREIRVSDDIWQGGNFEARGLDIEAIPHKFIIFKPQLFDDYPEREGFGPRALYFALFKRFSWRDRMQLLEIFGKPWKVIELDPGLSLIGDTVLDDAEDRVDEMGGNATIALAPGMKLNITQPDKDADKPHGDVSDACDDQISKLVLGNTRTSSAKSDGLGGKQAEVHQDGETLVINSDGWGVAQVVSDQLFSDWVLLNAGPDELINAPTYELEYKSPPDPSAEVERTVKAISVGVPLKVDEVYQAIGYSKPQPGDAVVTQTAPASPGGLGQPAKPAESSVSTIGAEQQPLGQAPPEGGQTDPLTPLALAAARSLRLSRLSSDYFSRRS
jgi:phage gp29-like protein